MSVSTAAVFAPRERRAGRRRIFTQDVLKMIPQWVEDGANREEIAAALGVTVGSLQSMCSHHGIRLNSPSVGLEARLGAERWAKVKQQADRRGTTAFLLSIKLLAAIVDGDLFMAVLDDNGEDDDE